MRDRQYLGVLMQFIRESPFLLRVSRLSSYRCNRGATPVIPGGNNAQYGQNSPFFVHCVDTMLTMHAVLSPVLPF